MSVSGNLDATVIGGGGTDFPLTANLVGSGAGGELELDLLGLEDINLEAGIGGRLDGAGNVIPIGLDIGLDDVNVEAGIGGRLDNAGNVIPIGVEAGLEIGGRETPVGLELGGGENPLVVDIGLDDINLELGGGENPLEVDFGLDNINVCLSLAVTEIPSVRVHLPTKSEFAFCLFGRSIFSFTFKGETMLVTEDNPPRVFHSAEHHSRPPQDQAGPTFATDDSDVVFTVTLDEESDDTQAA